MKNRTYLGLFIGLITFILLHNPILIGLSNISSILRKDNRITLDEKMYKIKIEKLEKQILEYESAYKNIKIYDTSSYILSKIALRDIYDFYNYIIITPESKVNSGSAVISENGLVGIIKDTDTVTAKVSLLTSGEKVSVKINNSYGLIDDYDKKDKLLIAHNINNYEQIKEGDIVETSGLSTLDGGINIGEVKKIEEKGIEKIVYVKPSVDFDNLNYLYVVNK